MPHCVLYRNESRCNLSRRRDVIISKMFVLLWPIKISQACISGLSTRQTSLIYFQTRCDTWYCWPQTRGPVRQRWAQKPRAPIACAPSMKRCNEHVLLTLIISLPGLYSLDVEPKYLSLIFWQIKKIKKTLQFGQYSFRFVITILSFYLWPEQQ